MEKYTVDYFIKKFKSIPSWRWIEGDLTDRNMFGFIRHCAMGHCGSLFSYYQDPTAQESSHLVSLINKLNDGTKLDTFSVASINDGCCLTYQQKTPKERILAALYDVKAKLEKPKEVIVEKIVEKTVYVTVDQEVRKLQEEELVLN